MDKARVEELTKNLMPSAVDMGAYYFSTDTPQRRPDTGEEWWRFYEGQHVDAGIVVGTGGETEASECRKYRMIDGQFVALREVEDVDAFYDADEGINRMDGPTNSFMWPLPDFQYSTAKGDPELAAALTADEPVCIVVVEEERFYLALTSGGMSYADRLCAAYIKLGYLPPSEATDVQDFNGPFDKERIVAACLRSNEVTVLRANRRVSRIMEAYGQRDES